MMRLAIVVQIVSSIQTAVSLAMILIVRRLIVIIDLISPYMARLKIGADDPRKLFGRKLRSLRTPIGLSQEELAFKAGLDRTYVGGVERGERNLGLLNICRLAEALQVPPSELLNFSDIND